MAGLGSEGAREAEEGQSHAIISGFMWGCRIVLQRVLVYTDVLVVYEHLCVFPERWSVSRLRMAILCCEREAQNSRDVPLSQRFMSM